MTRPHPLGAAISRRTVLKGIGAGVGCTVLLPSRSLFAQPGIAPPERFRAFVYLDHAGRSSAGWVIAGALFLDARRPRQMLQRAKRARLPRALRSTPQVKAASASLALAQYLYGLLAREGGLRLDKRGVELYSIHLTQSDLNSVPRDNRGHVHLEMVRTLLGAMLLSRFHEAFIYYNLPSVRAISRDAYRKGIEAMAGGSGQASLAAYLRRPLLSQGHRGLFTSHLLGEKHFPDAGIQVSDFVAQAFLQKVEGTDPSGAALLGPVVKAEIDAARVPGVVPLMA
jgi:hypothetical protein